MTTRFGDDSPPNRRLNCAGFCYNWPPPSPQSTTTASIPKSQHSPKRMKMEPQNDPLHPSHHSLNRKNIGRETTCTPSMCLHAIFSLFSFDFFHNFLFIRALIWLLLFLFTYFFLFTYLFLL